MHLLQLSRGPIIIASIIGGGIFFVILFYAVRAAVKEGTEGLRIQLRLFNNFKLEQMRRQGYTEDELKLIIEKAKH